MKLLSCCMIRCIALNTVDVEIFHTKLNKIINLYFPNAKITLETNIQYWKYPEENEIIYNLSNIEFILVANIIKIFPNTWNYTEGQVYDIDIQKSVNQEEAIWSKNTHPEEQFLMPEVNWVHVYTWKNREEPITN